MTPTLRTARLWLRPLAQAEPRVLEQIEAGTAIGWNLVPDGTDLVVGMVEHARTNLGLRRIEAHMDPGNSRSIRLAERLGFLPEGERGGTVVYARAL
ncbi:MAG TPA: GNAT family protein [Myxococcales bacterium]